MATKASKSVKYCKKSNLIEAWAQYKGLPVIFSQDHAKQAHTIETNAKKSIKDLTVDPTFVFVPQTTVPQSPGWITQTSWSNRKYISRFGYGHLSVHRMCDPQSNSYGRYESDVQPVLLDWLKIYKNSTLDADQQSVSLVSFGYVNKFSFHKDGNFDPIEYFNFGTGIDIGKDPGEAALEKVAAEFKFIDSKDGSALYFSINIQDQPSAKGKYEVVTNAFVEISSGLNVSFGNTEEIVKLTRVAQKKARDLFFSVVTDKTKDSILEAVYDDHT